MLETDISVLVDNSRSLSSLSLVIFKAKLTGIDVNKDTTSNETMTSSVEIDMSFMRLLKSVLLRTVYLPLIRGDKTITKCFVLKQLLSVLIC
jgi:hypothetical protein